MGFPQCSGLTEGWEHLLPDTFGARALQSNFHLAAPCSVCTECFVAGTRQFVDALFTLYSILCRVPERKGKHWVCWERNYDGKQSTHWSWSCCCISAAHITDNLLRSARSIRNKVLPTPLPCWHPSFPSPSACSFPGHQLCSQLLLLFTYHPGPGTRFLRSCPLIQTLRAGRFPFQNMAP